MKNNSNKNITDKLQTSYRQVDDKPNILDTKWTILKHVLIFLTPAQPLLNSQQAPLPQNLNTKESKNIIVQ